jgi:endo-1,4-beta-xylanase
MNVIRDGSHMELNAIKSPTVVLYNSHYDLYATVSDTSGNTNLQFITFTTWASSGSATGTFLDNLANFTGSHASPQLFYLNAQKKWYLISQSSGPGYSTASAPDQPASWTKPTSFFSSTPSVVTQNAGSGGVGWADFWVICDSTNCHMFFTNQNGYLFRSQTSVGNFPNGFGTPVVVMHGTDANSLYESSSVYKIKGTSKYLLLVAAVGSTGRYYRSWTADALDTTSWTTLADSEATPFAGASNVTFSGTLWTKDFVGGEVVRDGYDETMTLNPCNMQLVFQGKDPYASATGNAVEWRLGLLTRTN